MISEHPNFRSSGIGAISPGSFDIEERHHNDGASLLEEIDYEDWQDYLFECYERSLEN